MLSSEISNRFTGRPSHKVQAPELLGTPSIEDRNVMERIERALRKTGYSAMRSVEVSVIDRIVRLVGRVPSYHMKQIAQATALAVPGAHRIYNDLDVVRPN